MLNSYYTEALLGIKDAIISKVEKRSQEPIIDIWFSLKRDIHECPRCHELTETIHDYRKQTVKGPPLGEYFMLYHYKKRRYICTECGKRFYENNNFVPRYHRMSSSLISFILGELKSTSSLVSISKRCNVSTFTICRLFGYIAPGTVSFLKSFQLMNLKVTPKQVNISVLSLTPSIIRYWIFYQVARVIILLVTSPHFQKRNAIRLKWSLLICGSPIEILFRPISKTQSWLLTGSTSSARFFGLLIRYGARNRKSFLMSDDGTLSEVNPYFGLDLIS